jgi:hypothetical protein
MGHIFVSYSHKDTVYAHELAENLKSLGLDVWIDARLDYGSQWPHEIQKQLDTCDAFILIMTPRSFASEWVQSELQRAKRKSKPIFPLLLEGDEPWLSVESTQFYDVRGKQFPDARFNSAIKRVVSTSPTASTLQTPKALFKKATPARTGVVIAIAGVAAFILAISAIFIVGPVLFKGIDPVLVVTETQSSPREAVIPSTTATIAPASTSSEFSEQYDLFTEAQAWPLRESESFDHSDPDWLWFGNMEDTSVKHRQGIENGRFYWGLEPVLPEIFYWQVTPPYSSYSDFYLSFKIKRYPDIENSALYGLIFRRQASEFYLFRIEDGQSFAVQLYENGNWADIIGWTKTAAIKPGEFNELTVIADDSNMTFFINKVYVGSADNEVLSNGEIGLTVALEEVSPEVLFEFDDLELREKP